MNPLYQIVAQCQGLEVRIIGALPAPLFFLTLVTLGLALHVRSAIVHVSVPCGTNHGVLRHEILRKRLDSSEVQENSLDLFETHIHLEGGEAIGGFGDIHGASAEVVKNFDRSLSVFSGEHGNDLVRHDDDAVVEAVHREVEVFHDRCLSSLECVAALPMNSLYLKNLLESSFILFAAIYFK